jgi:hypothetical protein
MERRRKDATMAKPWEHERDHMAIACEDLRAQRRPRDNRASVREFAAIELLARGASVRDVLAAIDGDE